MKLVDWRSLPSSTMAALYRTEHMHWRRTLAWDTESAWATIEQARVTWGLPGVVAVNTRDEVAGWAFFVRRGAHLEVGGLVAESREATERLIDGIQDHARTTAGLRGFVHTRAPGIVDALARRGIAAAPHQYLSRLLDPSDGRQRPLDTALFHVSRTRATSTVDVRGWVDGDAEAAAGLLRDGYGEAGHLFAPHNTLPEWREYVDSLVKQTGCGLLAPELSRVISLNGRLQALAIVTTLSSRTVHVAQIVVAPALRRHGVAAGLMADVSARARRAGFALLSLIVASHNAPACELYRRLGLIERGQFLEIGGEVRGEAIEERSA